MEVALDRTSLARTRRLTLDDAARLLPYAAGMSACASVSLVTYKHWRSTQFTYGTVIVGTAVCVFAASLALRGVLRRLVVQVPDYTDRVGVVAWALALDVSLLLLVVPVLLLVKGTPADEILGWTWPLLNKRWLFALYNLAIAACLVVPVALARWLIASTTPPENGQVLHHAVRNQPRIRIVAGLLGLVLMCWYIAGPPWHLDRNLRSVEWHEQVHYGGLQAISKGYLPSVGPAATAYGPGSQVLTYTLMRLNQSFDLMSFRSAWAAEHFLAVFIIGTVAYVSLGPVLAIAAMWIALAYSPLSFYYWNGDGSFTGFWGWANTLRYCGPMIVVPALAHIGVVGGRTITIVLLGAAWGVASWVAQDSFTTTATATALLASLLWLTDTASSSTIIRMLGCLLIGFTCVVGLILVYYALHGAAGELLSNYFAFPRAIVAGLGNSWWPANEAASPDRISYYLMLPFLLACGVCTLWQLATMSVVVPLDVERARFLAYLSVQFACYQSVLFTSDTTHLTSVMIALPFIAVLGVVDLPKWLASTVTGRWTVRIAFVAASLVIFPMLKAAADVGAVLHHARPHHVPFSPPPRELLVGRTRPLLGDGLMFVGGDVVTVGEMRAFAADLQTLVGTRQAYVERIDWIAGGFIAFVADLTPAPHPSSGDLLTLNDTIRLEVADHIRSHPADYAAFIGGSLDGPQARAFSDTHPEAIRITRMVGQSKVYILLSP